jgi:protease I
LIFRWKFRPTYNADRQVADHRQPIRCVAPRLDARGEFGCAGHTAATRPSPWSSAAPVIAGVFAVPALGNTLGDAADRKAKGMAGTLQGNRTATLATDGVEQAELVQPRKGVTDESARVQIVPLSEGEIQAINRMDSDVRQFVNDIFRAGKPVGVICHGHWTLVEADPVPGRTLASFPSVRSDIRNAGGNVVDEEVGTDQGLVSSRSPGDLDAFRAKIVEGFAEGEHKVHDQGGTA